MVTNIFEGYFCLLKIYINWQYFNEKTAFLNLSIFNESFIHNYIKKSLVYFWATFIIKHKEINTKSQLSLVYQFCNFFVLESKIFLKKAFELLVETFFYQFYFKSISNLEISRKK
jgi:hypothetical protein